MEPLTTMEPFATIPELAELIIRIYAYEESGFMADTVFCYGQELENTKSVVERSVQLFRDGLVRSIAIPDQRTLERYQHFYDFIRTMLIERGVPKEKIVPIPHPPEFKIAHTHTEAIGLARYAREVDWTTIYITALPSHLLRAFAETVTAITREYPQLLAYSAVGQVLPWTEPTVHSQGTVSGKRFEVIGTVDRSELRKIVEYYLRGDLVSAREVLDYLNRRTDAVKELRRQQDEFFMCPPERRRRLIMGENNEVVGLD